MTDTSHKKITTGAIVSADLTVLQTEQIRDFYKAVIGWETQDMPLEDEGEAYADYIMKDADGKWVGGVCHKRGMNADLPPQWIVYIQVEDIGASVEKCLAHGGSVVKEMKGEDGTWYYALISDPSGAILGLTKA